MEAKQIRAIISCFSLSKKDFASIAGVSPRTVDNWLQGRKMSFQSKLIIKRWLEVHDKPF